MNPLNNVAIANYCLKILANGKKLPNYAYYISGDDVKAMFWDELTFNEMTKIYRHFRRLRYRRQPKFY